MDVMFTMPFANPVRVLTLQGKFIVEALEWSVAKYGQTDAGNEFLQVSGLHVLYDLDRPVGRRVVRVTARCANCEIPAYFPIDSEKSYSIAMGAYLADGGDGYVMFKKQRTFISNFNDLDLEIVMDYIKNKSEVYTQSEGRIQFASSSTTFSIKRMFLIGVIYHIVY